ncbi:1-acyl-sn-glycerol-3-phosphate acyltransferase [Gluconobacter wancherniae NBRC 103581]|nr:1-acyl-sn-glycerol-3-phosphate acyltransferase [Gluconobacter wancherniae NBRC 103581]
MMSIFRGLLFNAYLLLLTIVMGIGALPIRLSGRRNLALRYAKLWSKAVLAGLGKICGIRINVVGRENLPIGPVLIASQHQSFCDGFIWMNLLPRPAYVIKRELTKIPFVGPMLILSGMISVERSDGAKALRGMMKATADAYEDGRGIIIFPEGTRTLPGERHPIQPGIVGIARQASVPVIPVVTDSGLFWERSQWRKNPGTLNVVIGKPLPATKDRKEFIPALEKSWDELCATYDLPRDPVDNSVEAADLFLSQPLDKVSEKNPA